ncbi:MAG: glycosyltransferase [Saprospiraceae bacterium]|nr:glycosyltransferase [Saprospiraceae bacterium]
MQVVISGSHRNPRITMQILQLCKKFPYPLKDGESIAVSYLAQGLHRLGHEITLLAMNTTKHPVQVNRIKHNLSYYKAIHHTKLDNEVKPLHAFLNLFSSDSYNISRFDNEAFRQKLISVLNRQKFDVVQLESLYLAPYIDVIRECSDAQVVLRAHNVEHEIWERMSVNEPTALRRWYFDYSARKLKKYEIDQLSQIDQLLPISPIDEQKFRKLGYCGNSVAVPIGLDLGEFDYREVKGGSPLSVSFIGSLDWMPNIEALNWFIEAIWPHLNLIFPGLKLHVAGRNCPDWIRQLQSNNIIIEGEVEDSRKFLQQHPLTVVPLLSGSGMRAKIIEAMALGRVVITTTLGLEGINARDKHDVLIADSAEEFIRKFRFCYHHQKHLSRISQNARKLIEQDFDHLAVARSVEESYQLYNK